MADFLQNPDFKPDENFKNFIDNLFVEKPKEVKSSFELELPEAPELAESEITLALKIASDEFEAFKVAFLEFQDKVSDMAIYTFLYPSLEDFGQVCSELVDLVDNKFDQSKLSEVGKVNHIEAMKIRVHILSAILSRYKNNQ